MQGFYGFVLPSNFVRPSLALDRPSMSRTQARKKPEQELVLNSPTIRTDQSKSKRASQLAYVVRKTHLDTYITRDRSR
jgi:hypothetical protein